MKKVRYIREGPSRKRYGLSITKNREIDEGRKYLASEQAKTTKRDKLSRTVRDEGGEVYWRDEEKGGEIVLPYTKNEHEKLREREEKVAKKLKAYTETHRPRGLMGRGTPYISSGYDFDKLFQGEASFDLGYEADGSLKVTRLEKGKVNGRVYSIGEANKVLRNIERYIETSERIASFSDRHNRSSLDSVTSAVVAVVGIGGGAFLLSNNITGNVISSSTSTSTNVVGAILLIIGVISAFFYFKKK